MICEPVQVIQKPALHWSKHKIPRDVRACVIHIAEGSASSVHQWFNDPRSKVSAHLLVGLDGRCYQYVSIHDLAYHAGIVDRPTWVGTKLGNPNVWTVGIEHEGRGVEPWPEAMTQTSAILSAWLCVRFGWTPSALTFPMHREIRKSKTCPGPAFDRIAYLERVRDILRTYTVEGVRGLVRGLR